MGNYHHGILTLSVLSAEGRQSAMIIGCIFSNLKQFIATTQPTTKNKTIWLAWYYYRLKNNHTTTM
jgi:hypothetical protein